MHKMSSQKPVEWVAALMTRFEEQLPCRNGPQTHHTRINVQQNKESLIYISRWKFSLVISGLTKILTKINEMRSTQLPDFERDYYESLIIVLDTLEKCLNSERARAASKADQGAASLPLLDDVLSANLEPLPPPPQPQLAATSSNSNNPKYDDVMNVKLLLKEICQLLDLSASNATSAMSATASAAAVVAPTLLTSSSSETSLSNTAASSNSTVGQVAQIRCLASNVLFALSRNNFSAVFSRISGRLQELSVSTDESSDYTDIELIQHIDVDLVRLTKLLQDTIIKFKSLKKAAHLILMNSLEKAIWNWMDNHPQEFKELQRKEHEELYR